MQEEDNLMKEIQAMAQKSKVFDFLNQEEDYYNLDTQLK